MRIMIFIQHDVINSVVYKRFSFTQTFKNSLTYFERSADTFQIKSTNFIIVTTLKINFWLVILNEVKNPGC